MSVRRTFLLLALAVLAGPAHGLARAETAPAAQRPTCLGARATIVGTPRADVIRGTRRADVIAGLQGADRILGLGGNDLLCGGAGDDRIDGGGGRDRVDGGPGTNRCAAEARLRCAPGPPATTGLLTIPLQAVQASDDDGGRTAPMTPAEFSDWVAKANDVYAPAKIQFTFDPVRDWAGVRSTEVNSSQIVPPNAAFSVTSRHAGKVVVIVRHGPGPTPIALSYASNFGGHVVAAPYSYVLGVVGFDAAATPVRAIYPYLLAHELGHILGLQHTFPGDGDNVTDTLQKAADYIAAVGGTAAALDGDGIPDTPPDAGVGFYLSQGWDPCSDLHASYTISSLAFTPDRTNLMSYFYCGQPRTLTPLQLAAARRGVDTLVARGVRVRRT